MIAEVWPSDLTLNFTQLILQTAKAVEIYLQSGCEDDYKEVVGLSRYSSVRARTDLSGSDLQRNQKSCF